MKSRAGNSSAVDPSHGAKSPDTQAMWSGTPCGVNSVSVGKRCSIIDAMVSFSGKIRMQAFGLLKQGYAICSRNSWIIWAQFLAYYWSPGRDRCLTIGHQVTTHLTPLIISCAPSDPPSHKADVPRNNTPKMERVFLGLNLSRTRGHEYAAWAGDPTSPTSTSTPPLYAAVPIWLYGFP